MGRREVVFLFLLYPLHSCFSIVVGKIYKLGVFLGY